MDIIQMTREIGKEIQKDPRYHTLMAANAANDASAALQEKIANFSLLRDQVNRELMNPDKDQDKVAKMDAELRACYNEVMETPEMTAYNAAKADMEALLSFVMQILTDSANGMDPDKIEKQEEDCTGNCSSCGGCH